MLLELIHTSGVCREEGGAVLGETQEVVVGTKLGMDGSSW